MSKETKEAVKETVTEQIAQPKDDVQLALEAVIEAEKAEKPEEPKGEEEKPEDVKTKAEPEPEPESTEDKKKDDKIGSKLAELARRDRDLKIREQNIRNLSKRIQEYDELENSLKTDPLGTLYKKGIDIVDLVNQISARQGEEKPKDDPRVIELEKRLAAIEEEKKKAHFSQVYNQELANIHQVLQQAPDQYEWCLENPRQSLPLIFNALETIYEQKGSLPDREDVIEAARIVEEASIEEEKKEIERLVAAKRHQGRWGKENPPPSKTTPKQPQKKTLSNELQREAPTRKGVISDEEAFNAAVAIAQEMDFKL